MLLKVKIAGGFSSIELGMAYLKLLFCFLFLPFMPYLSFIIFIP